VVAADFDERDVDPITDFGRRAGCGYRCGVEAATPDSEHARPRYACMCRWFVNVPWLLRIDVLHM